MNEASASYYVDMNNKGVHHLFMTFEIGIPQFFMSMEDDHTHCSTHP